MVAFLNIIAAALALAVPIASQVTVKDVTNAIGEATTYSITIQKLVTDYPSEGKADSRLLVIIENFKDIKHTIDDISKEMKELKKVPEGELTDVVFEQYRQFVIIQNTLLLELDKMYRVIPAGPIIEALEFTQSSLDKFAQQLNDVFAREEEFTAQADSLDMSYEMILDLYDFAASNRKRSPTLRRRDTLSDLAETIAKALEEVGKLLGDTVEDIADDVEDAADDPLVD